MGGFQDDKWAGVVLYISDLDGFQDDEWVGVICVSEDRGYVEGEGAHVTLLTDTRSRVVSLAENAGRMPGVELRVPRNLCVCAGASV